MTTSQIQAIQTKIDNVIHLIESVFMVSRPGLVADLEEINDQLEGLKSDNFLLTTYAEMLYAYSGGHAWVDMSDDRKPFLVRAEKELREMGKV